MKSIILLFAFILASNYCTASKGADNSTSVIYGGLTFNAPANPLIIAQSQTDEKTLLLKYSREKGAKYLSFSSLEIPTKNKCSSEQLLSDIFTASDIKFCDHVDIDSFKKVFIQNAKITFSEKNDAKIYYSYSLNQTFIFIIKNSQSFKIESDFLSKENIEILVDDI